MKKYFLLLADKCQPIKQLGTLGMKKEIFFSRSLIVLPIAQAANTPNGQEFWVSLASSKTYTYATIYMFHVSPPHPYSVHYSPA